MREAGIAVSPLWPSTLWLYRRSGWEVAGRAETFSVSSRAIARMSGSGEPVSDPGTAARELQRHVAGNWNGPFERPDWWWDWRHPVPAPDRQYRYGWTEEGELTGFLAFRHLSRTDRAHGLLVTELWTRTGNALNGLLGFLGSHGAQVPEMTFGPAVLPMRHDLLWLACGADVQARGYAPWMLRLVDPRTALQARGWSAALDHRVELEIHDPMTERPQRLVLEVSGGEASITPGGSGEARLGLGALSAWYAGGLTAVRAARLGLASGPPEVLAAMDSLTRDRPAWLPEVF
jgi:predicted acetyltransferase